VLPANVVLGSYGVTRKGKKLIIKTTANHPVVASTILFLLRFLQKANKTILLIFCTSKPNLGIYIGINDIQYDT